MTKIKIKIRLNSNIFLPSWPNFFFFHHVKDKNKNKKEIKILNNF